MFGGNTVTYKCIFNNDRIFVDLSGYTYTLTDPDAGLVVGDDDLMHAEVDITDGTINANRMQVGLDGDSTGIMNVGTGAVIEIFGDIKMAYWGAGTLNITSGGQVRTTDGSGWIVIADSAGSTGTVLVSGVGSLLDAEAAPIIVGNGDDGSLLITDGGTVHSAGELFMASAEIATSTVTVSGPDSIYVSDSIYPSKVAERGDGLLIIENGGTAQFSNMQIGTQPTGTGTVTLNGSASALSIMNGLQIGSLGSGTVNVNDGRIALGNINPLTVPSGRMYIGANGLLKGVGNLNADVIANQNGSDKPGGTWWPHQQFGTLNITGLFAQTEGGTILIEVGGTIRNDEYSVLNVSGTMMLAGTLELELINDFAPALDDTFDVLDWGQLQGEFDNMVLPELEEGLLWDTSELLTNGQLSIMPRPTLTIDPDPLIAGQQATFTVIDCKPNKLTALAYSLVGSGSTYIPQLKVTLDLAQPKQAGDIIMADNDGIAQWSLPVPSQAAGLDVWIQAAQYEAVSNLIETTVQ